jgi:hypothetical protein
MYKFITYFQRVSFSLCNFYFRKTFLINVLLEYVHYTGRGFIVTILIRHIVHYYFASAVTPPQPHAHPTNKLRRLKISENIFCTYFKVLEEEHEEMVFKSNIKPTTFHETDSIREMLKTQRNVSILKLI